MSFYQTKILTIIATDARLSIADPRHVEAFLRSEFDTLDSLSGAEFVEAALECAEFAIADRNMAESLAQSYGL